MKRNIQNILMSGLFAVAIFLFFFLGFIKTDLRFTEFFIVDIEHGITVKFFLLDRFFGNVLLDKKLDYFFRLDSFVCTTEQAQ